LLDLDEPWKVMYRGGPCLLSPWKYYECAGNAPNVVFPCATLFDSHAGRIAIFYGVADTVTALVFAKLDEVLDFIKSASEF
jgi:beta-1,4-mannooligosaccharide/beta-1,4-mannosyl-N-acetylglucosamine phosphorylase